MRFNSFEFVVFFAAFFLMFVLAPKTYRPLIVVMASYVFYAAWRASFLLLLLATTAVDFSSALVIDLAKNPLTRRAALATALTARQVDFAVLSLSPERDPKDRVLEWEGILAWLERMLQ